MEITSIPFVTVVQLHAADAAEAIRLLNERLVEKGFTEPRYAEAVIEREQVFPTGLPTEPPVAIPHADPDFVLQAAGALGILDAPVLFQEMGNPDQTLPVRLIFLLALARKEDAVGVLRQLTRAFRDGEGLGKLQQAQSAEQAEAALRQLFQVNVMSPEPGGE